MILKSDDADIKKVIERAVINIMRNQDAFSYLIMRIPIVIKNSDELPELSSNQTTIFVNSNDKAKKFFNQYNSLKEKFLEHEILHIILNHIYRAQKAGIDLRLANVVEDFLINSELKIADNSFITESNFQSMFGLDYMEIEEYKTYNFERICKLLADKMSKMEDFLKMHNMEKGNNENNGSYGFLSPETHVTEEKDEDAEKEIENESKDFPSKEEWINDVVKKSIVYGKEKSGLWKEIDDLLLKGKINWKGILKFNIQTVKSQEDAEEGVRYVNRRYYQNKKLFKNNVLPFNNKKEIYNKIVIAIDSSGSVTDKDFIQEISEVVNLVKKEKINGEILLFTESIEEVIKLNQNTNINDLIKKLKSRKYGGTSFVELFKYCTTNWDRLLIILTDLEGEFPEEKKYPFKTLFITSTTDSQIVKECEKFGKVIKYEP